MLYCFPMSTLILKILIQGLKELRSAAVLARYHVKHTRK